MSNLDLTENRHPQDGRINLRLGERTFQLRLSLFPSVTGYSAVIRFAEQTAEGLDVSKIGLSPHDLERYLSVIERPNGLVLITGPTGSGKSTTLYASLTHLNKAERKILTIEDPVERQLAGVTQMEINEAVGLTFADGLRSALRHNPDVIMVGEIRDGETAAIAIQASLTGHVVFSTLHTNDAASSVTRLINMGIEPFLVASSLGGVMAQRLLRVLCASCKQPYSVPAEQLQSFGVKRAEALELYQAGGCEKCVGTGYLGRQPVFELLLHSPAIEQLILEHAADTAIRRKAQDEGMHTLQQEVARKVGDGVTSVEEAMRVVQSRWAHEGAGDAG
jgi:general secretion pathway protein E